MGPKNLKRSGTVFCKRANQVAGGPNSTVHSVQSVLLNEPTQLWKICQGSGNAIEQVMQHPPGSRAGKCAASSCANAEHHSAC